MGLAGALTAFTPRSWTPGRWGYVCRSRPLLLFWWPAGRSRRRNATWKKFALAGAVGFGAIAALASPALLGWGSHSGVPGGAAPGWLSRAMAARGLAAGGDAGSPEPGVGPAGPTITGQGPHHGTPHIVTLPALSEVAEDAGFVAPAEGEPIDLISDGGSPGGPPGVGQGGGSNGSGGPSGGGPGGGAMGGGAGGSGGGDQSSPQTGEDPGETEIAVLTPPPGASGVPDLGGPSGPGAGLPNFASDPATPEDGGPDPRDPPTLPIDNPIIPPGLAVPEPATWVMMIAGFAAVGSALRQRRARAQA